jgi:uncharacterized protein with LGFP repeats
VITGNCVASGVPENLWIASLDADGAVDWQQHYGGASDDYGSAIAVNSNGDIFAGGNTISYAAHNSDFWIVSPAANGDCGAISATASSVRSAASISFVDTSESLVTPVSVVVDVTADVVVSSEALD